MRKFLSALLVIVFLLSSVNLTKVDAFTTKPKVTDEQMLIFSTLAYVNFQEKQKYQNISKIKSASNVKSSKRYKELKSLLGSEKKVNNLFKKVDSWRLIQYINDSEGWTKFGAAVFENTKTKTVVVAYRGSDSAGDWVKENFKLVTEVDNLNNSSNQRRFAELVAAQVLFSRPNSDVYFTGHSLGGFLAQYITYEVKERILHTKMEIPKLFYTDKKHKKKLKEFEKQNKENKKKLSKLAYQKRVGGLVTFNAPGVIKTTKNWNKQKEKYKLAKNYVISGDAPGEFNYSLGKGKYGKTYLKNKKKITQEHGVIHFYKYTNLTNIKKL